MVIMNDMNDQDEVQLFLQFKNAGPTIVLIGPALAMNIVGIPGALLNAFVVLTTIRTNSLRGSANFLIASISLFETIHQLGHLFFLVIAASGTNFISLRVATLCMAPQIFALYANMMSTFCAAMDRLLALMANNFHNKICSKIKKPIYLGLLSAIIAGYGTFWTSQTIVYSLENPEIPTTGCIAFILGTGNSFFWRASGPLLGSVTCYCIVGLFFCFNKNVTKETNLRLLRSLILILSVSIGCYLIGLGAYYVLSNFDLGLGHIAVWEVSFLPGVLVNLGAAANGPILYVNSIEYRNAFKHQLEAFSPKLSKLLLSSNPNSTVQQFQYSQSQQQPQHLFIGRRVSVWSTEQRIGHGQ